MNYLFVCFFLVLNLILFWLFYVKTDRSRCWSIKITLRQDKYWTACGALNTLLAVLYVLVVPSIIDYIDRPKIEFSLFKQDFPYVILLPNSTKPERLLLLLMIENEGNNNAENAKVAITNFADCEDSGCTVSGNWAPIPIPQIFAQQSNPLSDLKRIQIRGQNSENLKGLDMLVDIKSVYAGEFDMLPKRPYIFLLGIFGQPEYKEKFKIIYTEILPYIASDFPNGRKYCFEITLYAKNMDPKAAYIFIEWKGEFSTSLEKIKENLTVKLLNDSPWQK